MIFPSSKFRLLTNMNLGFWGMQIGNGLQTANASALFESLGAEVSQLPLLWLGAPLMGLVAQPIVGELSDRTWNTWGRRQPYFLGGALLGTVTLVALPLATQLWQAIALFWLLQLGLNIAIAPSRPFVGDLLAPEDRTLGYTIQGFCVGLGALTASGLPWVFQQVLHLRATADVGTPPAITGAYWLGAVILVGGTLWTFWTVDELPPPTDVEELTSAIAGLRQTLGAIAQALPNMPSMMRQLIGVQILTWAGIYCSFLYLPTAIAFNIFDAPNRQSASFVQGIEWAGVCIAFYNLVCLGISFLLPRLCQRWGRVTIHAVCLMCGAMGLISLGWIHHQYPVLLSMIGVGIAWASVLSIPYSLLMDELSETQSGVYMGLFNVFIALPQLLMSLGFGWVMHSVLQGNRLWALMLGGVSMGLAALLMLAVSEPAFRESPDVPPGSDRLLATKE